MKPPIVSLFDNVRKIVPDNTSYITCSKATLVHISHTIEDIVLTNRIPALMFTGFQESSHWKQETERYRALADTAKQICIFAGKPLPAEQPGKVVQVELEGDDPLRQEWFVLIFSESFSVLLTGKDNIEPVEDESARQFETLLSFQPDVILSVIDRLESVLDYYNPDAARQLRQARTIYPVRNSDPLHMTTVMNEMLRYEETLQRKLREANERIEAVNRKLKQERDFSRQIIQTSPAFFVTTTPDGIIQMINPILSQMIERDTDNLEGQIFWEALGIEAEYDRYMQAYITLKRTREPVTYTAHLRLDDGLLPVEWHSNLVWQDDEPLFIFAMGLDLRDRQRIEKLRQEEERLRVELETERELSDLRYQSLSTISHEFRTPLATVLTAIEIIERYGIQLEEEKLQKRVTTIKNQVHHLDRMVSDVTFLLDSHKGYLQFNPESTSIIDLFEQIISEVQLSTRTNHEIIFRYDWEADRTISADPELITYILRNLLSNAIKYSPATEDIIVDLKRNDGSFTFSVQDRGIGIPKNAQKRIFEAFYRADNVDVQQGTGLGLNIVADAVRTYGGDLHYKSGDGGSIFVVELPILPAENAASV